MSPAIIGIMVRTHYNYVWGDLRIIANHYSPLSLDITTIHDTRVRIYAYKNFFRIVDLTSPMNRPVSFFVSSPVQDLLLKPKRKIDRILIIGGLPEESEVRKFDDRRGDQPKGIMKKVMDRMLHRR